MNYPQHILDTMFVSRKHVREAVRVLVHSIIFQRALGIASSLEEEGLGLVYVRCADNDVEQRVSHFVDSVDKLITKKSRDKNYRSNVFNFIVKIEFFVSVPRRRVRMFVREEKIGWEEWKFGVSVGLDKLNSSSTPSSKSSNEAYAFSYQDDMSAPYSHHQLDTLDNTSVPRSDYNLSSSAPSECLQHVHQPMKADYGGEGEEASRSTATVTTSTSATTSSSSHADSSIAIGHPTSPIEKELHDIQSRIRGLILRVVSTVNDPEAEYSSREIPDILSYRLSLPDFNETSGFGDIIKKLFTSDLPSVSFA